LEEDWRFAEPRNVAVITLRQIISDGEPILHVTHDAEDGVWQFLGWGDAQEEDAKIVGLGEIVQLDPSVEELADLPPGWHAWRAAADRPWQRGQK
jgi:hypothetical protein